MVRFEERPLAVLLAGTPEGAEALARSVLGEVLDLPLDDRQLVLQTARTWLAAAGSTSEAATRLHIHRNTVRHRLGRLDELYGSLGAVISFMVWIWLSIIIVLLGAECDAAATGKPNDPAHRRRGPTDTGVEAA